MKYLEDIVDAESASEFAKDALKQLKKITTRLEMRLAVEHPRITAAIQKIYQVSPLK